MLHRLGMSLIGVGLATLSQPAQAQGWFDSAPIAEPVQQGEVLSITPSIGYLQSISTENVYDPISRSKISQLDWKGDAMTVGGRIAVRPLENVTLRGSIWAAVAADGDMKDRDWLFGYRGSESWSHQSVHPDTRIPKAWQGDVSLAYLLGQTGDMSYAAIAGFRHYDVKYRAYGGSYVYSVYGFRDMAGSFNAGELGIAYRQVWDTPYLGLGAYYHGTTLSLSTEIYGSPVAFARDQDYHALRNTLFAERFTPAAMIGANVAVEYRLTSAFSLVGRLDYARYAEAKGNTRIYDAAGGDFYRIPKPSSGADSQTLNVSLGVKGKI
jgi:outer membrane protease